VGQRRVANFAIVGEGNSAIPNSQGIRIYNTSNIYGAPYGLQNIDFENLLVAQFDTCIDAEDLTDSQFLFNKIQNCRTGLTFFGNDQNNYVAHNTIDAGTLDYTNQTGITTGFLVQQNIKYGGGSEQPQGVYFTDNSVENWSDLVVDEECIDCRFSGVQGDVASNVGMLINENGVGGFGVWVDHSTFGMSSNAAVGLYVSGIADSGTPANLGFWAEDNHFVLDGYPGVEPSSNVGLLLNSVLPFAEAHITGNQCMGMATCIQLNSNLYDSVIKDNFAQGTLDSVVNLSGTSDLTHTHTVVDNNFDYYDNVPAVNVGTSSGATVLYNCTASGCTTPTYPTLGVGNGFSGTKTAGSCVLTIAGGIITGVTGC
jgi:hypothetical protein